MTYVMSECLCVVKKTQLEFDFDQISVFGLTINLGKGKAAEVRFLAISEIISFIHIHFCLRFINVVIF